MKLFVFEPHKWDFCGGAIVVIASTEQHAHELIWKRQEEENQGRTHRHEIGVDSPWSIKMDGAMFAPFPKIKGRYMECDRWELTGEFPLLNLEGAGFPVERVVCFNYNFA